jgi:hypothetical protein
VTVAKIYEALIDDNWNSRPGIIVDAEQKLRPGRSECMDVESALVGEVILEVDLR